MKPRIRAYEFDAIDRAAKFDAGRGIIPAVLSTGARARDGFIIEQAGWDLRNFKRNPVVLFNHDDGAGGMFSAGSGALPIGRWEQVGVEDGKLRGVAHLDMDDEFAARVAAKIGRSLINATSVRWIPLEHRVDRVKRDTDADAEAGKESVIVFTRSELLEASFVTLPSDPGAMIQRADGRAMPFAAADFVERMAMPGHDTGTTEEPWDGPGAVADAPNEAAMLRHMHAWRDADGDPDAKGSYKFPHHAPRMGSAANLPGVRNALARLSQADIPEGDREGVERHLRRHLEAAEASAGLAHDIDPFSLVEVCDAAHIMIEARSEGVFTPAESAAAARLYDVIAQRVASGVGLPARAADEIEGVLDALIGMVRQLAETVAAAQAEPRASAADVLLEEYARATGRSVEGVRQLIAGRTR